MYRAAVVDEGELRLTRGARSFVLHVSSVVDEATGLRVPLEALERPEEAWRLLDELVEALGSRASDVLARAALTRGREAIEEAVRALPPREAAAAYYDEGSWRAVVATMWGGELSALYVEAPDEGLPRWPDYRPDRAAELDAELEAGYGGRLALAGREAARLVAAAARVGRMLPPRASRYVVAALTGRRGLRAAAARVEKMAAVAEALRAGRAVVEGGLVAIPTKALGFLKFLVVRGGKAYLTYSEARAAAAAVGLGSERDRVDVEELRRVVDLRGLASIVPRSVLAAIAV